MSLLARKGLQEETTAADRPPSKAPGGQGPVRLSAFLRLRGPTLPGERARALAAAGTGKAR